MQVFEVDGDSELEMVMIAVENNIKFYGSSYKTKMKKNKREIKTNLGRT
jgi:hypothetical protein